MYKGAVEGCQLPWITRDFHTLLLHTPFHAGRFPAPRTGRFLFSRNRLAGVPLTRRTIPQRRQVEHLPGGHAPARRAMRKKRPDDDSSGRGGVGAGFRKRGCFAPRSAKRTESASSPAAFFPAIPSDRVTPSPRLWLPRAAFPQESCLSCCRPCPPPRSASPDRPRDRPRGECGPSGT